MDVFVDNFSSFLNKFGTDKVKRALEKLIIWMMCNYNSQKIKIKSMIYISFSNIHKNLILIFGKFFQRQEIAEMMI